MNWLNHPENVADLLLDQSGCLLMALFIIVISSIDGEGGNVRQRG
jgi:hypothetical protein